MNPQDAPVASDPADRARESVIAIACRLFVAGVIAFMVGNQLHVAWLLKDHLTENADAYSEADVVRSAEAFRDHGFSWNVGLPEVSYGDAFPGVGGKFDQNLCGAHAVPRATDDGAAPAPAERAPCVYLHNPPGMNYVTGVMMMLAGPHVMFVYRLAPILLGLFTYWLLARALFRTQGPARTAFVYLAFAIVPMSWNMMHGIADHSYNLHLFLIELAILLVAFDRDTPLTRGAMIGLAAAGLAQGLVSYEYAAIVALLPIPACLAMRRDWRARDTLKKTIAACVIAGGAFAFMQVLHLLQVAVYLGGIGDAVHDLAQRGALRAGGDDEAYTAVGLISLYFAYFSELLDRRAYVGFSFIGFAATIFAALRAPPSRPFTIAGARLVWEPQRRWVAAFAFALLLPSIWVTMMQAHARLHGHFIPRTYLVAVVFGALLVARSVRSEDERAL